MSEIRDHLSSLWQLTGKMGTTMVRGSDLKFLCEHITRLEEFYEAVTDWLDAHPRDDFRHNQRYVEARRAVEEAPGIKYDS